METVLIVDRRFWSAHFFIYYFITVQACDNLPVYLKTFQKLKTSFQVAAIIISKLGGGSSGCKRFWIVWSGDARLVQTSALWQTQSGSEWVLETSFPLCACEAVPQPRPTQLCASGNIIKRFSYFSIVLFSASLIRHGCVRFVSKRAILQ